MHPYQPTVQDRTGEFLMRGISGAADSLAEGIRTWKKNKEESGGFDTLIEGAVRADPTLAEKYGDQLAKAPGMSLSQKKSLAGTLALETQNKRLAKEEQAKQQDFNLRKAYFDLQQGQMTRANDRDAAGQRFTQSLASLMGTGGGPSMDFANTLAGEPMPARDVGLADIVQAAGQSGLALDPERLAPLLRADSIDRRGGRELAGPPQEFSVGGMSGVYMPKTGQFQVERTAPTELTPAQKQQYISSLRGRRVQLLGDLNKSVGTDEDRAMLRDELAILDEELMGLGAKVSAPKPAAGTGGKAVGRFNPQTGKFERY
jgi:hypothetical protein